MANLAVKINQPNLSVLIRRFLFDQLNPNYPLSSSSLPQSSYPYLDNSTIISTYSSALATFYAPSDQSGIGGMHFEHIRATPLWRNGPPRYDCAFVDLDPSLDGLRGLGVVRILQFFSFSFDGVFYPCALVHWFSAVGDEPDEDTGMWIVEKDFDLDGDPSLAILHLDCIFRAAHLIGFYGTQILPKTLRFHNSLDSFDRFFVSKYADHHMFAVAF